MQSWSVINYRDVVVGLDCLCPDYNFFEIHRDCGDRQQSLFMAFTRFYLATPFQRNPCTKAGFGIMRATKYGI